MRFLQSWTFGTELDFRNRWGSLQTTRTLAIKKIRLGKYMEGVNVTALREIKLLKELHDPNIIIPVGSSHDGIVHRSCYSAPHNMDPVLTSGQLHAFFQNSSFVVLFSRVQATLIT